MYGNKAADDVNTRFLFQWLRTTVWGAQRGHSRIIIVILSVFFTMADVQAGMFSLSEQDEIAIGRQAAAQVEQKVRILRDPGVQNYVSKLGMELAHASARPNLPWRFRVIEDKRINAFALPGGFIYVHSKVLEIAGSEAELASVIAHEIGHVEGRHHKARIEKAMRYQLGLGVLGALVGGGGAGNAAMIAGKLLAQGQLTKYSRRSETDADRRGVKLLYRTGFDPMSMSRFLQNLVKLERGNRDLLAGFFADHPAARDRVASTRAQAQALPKKTWRGNSGGFLRMAKKQGGHVLSGGRIREGAGHYEGARIKPKRRVPSRYEGSRIHPRTR